VLIGRYDKELNMRRVSLFIGAMLLGLTACGGDSGGGEVSDTSNPSDSTSAPASGAISSKEDARSAVVRIVSQGSFRDPEVGFQSGAGSGSGFIISADGLVVTNQHVVEGAGSVEVFIDGEDRPLNARILGVSECNDLAVLDLEGDGYPYFEWFEGTVEAGIDVWAAGFPMGDPEYSISRGSVVKAEADGETEWASFDFSIEHDATTEPGNSGGPVITEDGRVVGVHYAGGDLYGNGVIRRFAIPAELAIDVVEVLSQGQDQDSIGINGTAVAGENLAGIWVSGVRAGSPASDLGIEAGDVVLSLGGRDVVSQDDLDRYGFATKSGYCDVLRTQGTDRAIEITVLRFDTGEILSGELNNPERQLEVVQTISSQLGAGDSGSYDYETVTDIDGVFAVDLPVQWSERNFTKWEFFGVQNPSIQASADLNGYRDTWTTAGIEVIFAKDLDEEEIDDALIAIDSALNLSTICTLDGTKQYTNGSVAGQYLVYSMCDGNSMLFVIGAFWDPITDGLIILTAQIIDDADLQAIDQVLASIVVL